MPNARSVTLFFYTAMPNVRSAILFFRNAMPNGADDTIIFSVPGNIKMKSLFFLTILLLPDDYPIDKSYPLCAMITKLGSHIFLL